MYRVLFFKSNSYFNLVSFIFIQRKFLSRKFVGECSGQISIVLIKQEDYFPDTRTSGPVSGPFKMRVCASRSNYSVEYSVEYYATECKCIHIHRCLNIDDRLSKWTTKAFLAPSESFANDRFVDDRYSLDRSLLLLLSNYMHIMQRLTNGFSRLIFSICRKQCGWHLIKIYLFYSRRVYNLLMMITNHGIIILEKRRCGSNEWT